MTKSYLRVGTAVFCAAIAVASVADRALAQSASCPCTIWPSNAVPANAAATDGQPIETGVKFRSDVDGFVTAIRFYKGAQNTGTHVGHLWSSAGVLLAAATFTGETASGWQEVQLSPAVAIAANTTYVASYHADSGFFAIDAGFFATGGVDAPPLHALQSGVDGPNGVFVYGAAGFPSGASTSNYWIDVVLQTNLGPDVTPPAVASVVPASGSTGAAPSSTVRAVFSEAIDAATINASTFQVRDETGALVSGSVTYGVSTRTATFATTAGLLAQSVYTATISGDLRDLAGNLLATDVVWSFTTGNPAPANDGPGGPILVISGSSNPFSRYYSEILRTEGLNEFTTSDISLVTPAVLGSYDVVLLGEIPLTAAQVAMLTEYVLAGGSLVAMRPDKQLASLLGLTDQSSTLANAYLQIDTSSQPGAGIVSDTIQFHGAADRYAASGAGTIATLFSDASTATASPAVTIAAAGSNGGQAAAFTFDLARSIVYTRQGNPAWSGQERDHDKTPLIRSDDLFFGAATGDVQPDWVDLNKVAIPQADEQQRLLANLLLYLNRARKPLPRFWYLPRSLKAAIVMTGDDHANGGTVGRFNQYKTLSAPGCSVADWQCIRGTSYIFNNTPGMDNAASLGFVNDGFEVALHVTTNVTGDCGNWTPASLATFYSTQVAQFQAARPDVPPVRTNRTHCIAWSDYVTQPKVELANGIRFDTNYYYFPGNWVQNRPGFFTGSGMPMRFADLDGTTIDVYQATTQMTDESDQTYPFTADTLLDRALGPLGYYGIFTANHHTDAAEEQQSTATVASAIARNVPVVSARQMLDWLDARNGSSFGSIAWTPGALTFTIAAHPGANGLTAMVPTHGKGGVLTGLTRDGAPVGVTVQVVKGVEYAFFPANSGNYAATYFVDVIAPAISDVAATPGLENTAAITWTTDEPADSRVEFGTSASLLTGQAGSSLLVTSHNVVLSGLLPSTTYYYRVTSADGAGNSSAAAVDNFTTPATMFAATDTTVADFGAGTLDGQVYIAQTADGEVILGPAAGSEFAGASLPPDWSMTAWTPGGAATVSGGVVTVDGARAGTIATYPAGRSLEFVATFSGAPFQHIGFAETFEGTPWAMFSTVGGNSLVVRTDSSSLGASTPLSSSLLGSPHRFRIDWTPAGAIYSVDGTIVASHAIAINVPLRPLVSDVATGTGVVTVDSMRMSPYASGGTFLSRVFDAGTAVNWATLSWTAQTPSATSAALFARHGDTPAPDVTWTAFAPVSATDDAIGGNSRYLQYRIDLASSDSAVTPAVEQVTIGYSEIPPNHLPVATDDSFSGTEDIALTAAAPGVLANDTDADGDPLSAILVSGPSHGALALQANGSFTYTPAADFSGTDSFAYTANDGSGDSNVAVVSLAIAATNDLPVAGADAYSTNEDTVLTVAAPGVLANDTDADGDPLSSIFVSGPSHGSLVLQANGSFTYTPAADFSGADSFSYRTSDGTGDSNVAGVSIAIAAANDLPVAGADAYSTNEGTALTVNAPGVLANDADVDGDSLAAILVTGPSHGTITLQATGAFTYTPAAGFSGADSFTYTANDGTGGSNVATVSIAIAATNHPPAAANDSFSGSHAPLTVPTPGVLGNDSDADGDSLVAILVGNPAHGTVALQPGGAFTYTPSAGFSGTDAFTYKANDGRADSNTAMVAIAIGATMSTATDTTATDFGAGTLTDRAYVAETANGEVILRPAAGSEFAGTALPVDWATNVWHPDGTAAVSGGALVVDGAWAGTIAMYSSSSPSGRSLEFVATFNGAAYQHVGFGETYDAAPWAIFSTAAGGGLFARTASGDDSVDTPLPGALLGSPHRFRIDWTPTGVTYTVDGTEVASHAITIDAALRPLASDFTPDDGTLTVDWIRMSPYASQGTFLSRVIDAGSTVNWGTLAWTAQVPPGTSAAFFARHGDTPAPDGTWTAFVPIAVSGGAIGDSSRFLQYRADLASGDPDSTPSIDQVSVGYAGFPPNHVPVATDDSFATPRDTPLAVAAPGVLANDTDGDGESLVATLVNGPAHGSIALQATGAFIYTPAAGFTGTDGFSYRASDGADDSIVAVVSIAIGATPFTSTDTTAADFGAGTLTDQTSVARTTDGEVILRPAAGSEFAGTALPADWATGVWHPDGAAAVAGGALAVDGAWAGTIATYPSTSPAGRSLEFVATFTGAAYQHVGFGETFEGAPWAIFSTFAGGGLFARTASGGASMDTPIPGALGSPHRFRIDWRPTGVTYTVDGTIVATHAIAVDAALRPLVSDFTPGDGTLTVDWIRMGAYPSHGSFLSRVVDAGELGTANWGALAWTAQVPPGTSASFSVRHGDTPVPDATWTAFAPVAVSGGAIGGSSRYLQYRVDLASGDPGSTPSIEQVSIAYWALPQP